ncbi:MAG: DUF748 domain-containing protein, partial [Bacteroidetes bacterium]|nr:DUF748 domain-containing protein [Bacteroidota bacterium]
MQTPYVHLIRGKDANWNFADLLTKRSGSSDDKKLPFSFFVGGVKIQNGIIEVTDLSEETPFHKTLQLALLDVSLSLKKGVKFSVQSTLDRRESVIEINGNYDPLAKKFEAACSLRGIDVPEWLQFLKINP